jgi:hypothetical protein
MRITNIIEKILFLVIFLIPGGCKPEPDLDLCLKTKWPLPKEYEIKLAVKVSASNPTLPGGTTGSQNPADFEKLLVNGTIEKVECSGETTGPVNLGNTYLIKGVDLPAPIDVPKAYWIGHVVYVYEFGNDNDNIDINLTVKITMKDGQSYTCTLSEEAYYQQIIQVPTNEDPTEMYYYILLDIYSDQWVKV